MSVFTVKSIKKLGKNPKLKYANYKSNPNVKIQSLQGNPKIKDKIPMLSS